MGRLRYSLLLDDHGGILDDLILTRRRDGIYIVVNGATKADDVTHLRSRLPEAVALEVLEDRALLALQGPAAAVALARHAPEIARLGFLEGDDFLLAGMPAWISRSGYTGEDGFEISIAADQAEALASLLAAEPEVEPAGLGARDSLRLEAGLPLYGHDLDRETSPIAADLTFALSKRRRQAGGYSGAEAVARELACGAANRRVGLLVEGRQPVREGATVIDGQGRDIGRVTSGGFSPSLEVAIAMAYVPVALAIPGTAILLMQRGRPHHATVAPLPFVPHRYARSHDALLYAGT
jgi:aminomethyltransferase